MNKRTDESSVKVSEPRLAGLKLEILTRQTDSIFLQNAEISRLAFAVRPAVFSRTILDCFTPHANRLNVPAPANIPNGAGPGVLRNSQFTSMRLAEMAI